MANIKITDLPSAAAVGTSVVPVTNAAGNATNKVTLADIAALAPTPTISYTDLTNVPSTFNPPTASSSVLGGVKVGSGLAITDGVLSASDSRWNLFLPPAPTNLAAGPGNAQVVLTWTAPTVLAQAPIQDYVVQYSSNSGSTWTTFSDGTSSSTGATVTGLTNGTAYVFRVAAVNGVGTGAYTAASAAATPTTGDALFGSVSLLLHFDGASITDSSSYAHAVTEIGGVSLSSAQSKFGGTSGYFDGGRLSIGNSAAFGLANEDFTVEFWAYPTTQTQVGGLINFGTYDDGLLWRHGAAPDLLYLNGSSGNWSALTHAPLGQWTHLALVRNGNTVSVYANGTSVYSTSFSGDLNASNAVIIGTGAHSTGEWYRGYIDELRVTKGAARYTANFTPPSAAFLDS